MPKCDFSQVALHIFRTTFSKNTSGWLLPKIKPYIYIAFLFRSAAPGIKSRTHLSAT